MAHSLLYLMSLSTAMTPSILSCILQRSGSEEGSVASLGPTEGAIDSPASPHHHSEVPVECADTVDPVTGDRKIKRARLDPAPAWPHSEKARAALDEALACARVPSLRHHQVQALRHLLDNTQESTKQADVAAPSVVQCVRTGGGKTLVPMLFGLLRRDYPSLFPGNRRILAFCPTVALL